MTIHANFDDIKPTRRTGAERIEAYLNEEVVWDEWMAQYKCVRHGVEFSAENVDLIPGHALRAIVEYHDANVAAGMTEIGDAERNP